MSTIRASGVLAFAMTLIASTLALTVVPVAHADALGDLRQAVNNARARSTCGPLNYNTALEGEAQHHIGNNLTGVPAAGQYPGSWDTMGNTGDPEQAAVDAVMNGGVSAAVQDCSWKDFGVGFFRSGSTDHVAVSLGKPNTAPPAPAADEKPVVCTGGQAAGQRLPAGSSCCPPGSVAPTAPPGQQCQAAPPVNCPAGSVTATVPAGQQCKAVPAPKDAVTLTFRKDNFQIHAIIVNKSAMAGQCHYDAVNTNGIIPERIDDFPIGANATVTRTYPAPPPLAHFHVTVQCTGDFNGTTDEFGNTATDVTG